MAPAVLAHPGARPIRSTLMDTTSVAYVLCNGSRIMPPLPPSVSTKTSLVAWQPVSIR
jgi:hypothetical protein